MYQFWYEFFHFVVYISSFLVSVSAVALFLYTVSSEKVLNSKWRIIGFFLLAVACFHFIFERKYPILALSGTFIELLGFFFIFLGVQTEPDLSILQNTVGDEGKKEKGVKKSIPQLVSSYFHYIIGIVSLLALGLLFFINKNFIYSGAIVISTLYILLTIRLQIIRYQQGSKERHIRLQNLYPLLGYVFLFFRQIFYLLFRLPEGNIIFWRQHTILYGNTWVFAVIFTLIGFTFLGIWAWNFIKLRYYLRTFVVFLTLGVFVATSGSLINILLMFNIIERDNLDLMRKASRTQKVIMQERSKFSSTLSEIIAEDDDVQTAFAKRDYATIAEIAQEYFDLSGVDILKFYFKDREVIAAPSDTREMSSKPIKDRVLEKVVEEEEPLNTMDSMNGVLARLIYTRALHPIIVDSKLIGVIETGFVFDTAYVDYTKGETNTEVTVYYEDTRSATTLKTSNGVDRWVGSTETDPRVLQYLISQKTSYAGVVKRLGEMYYSAFQPIVDHEGRGIGILAVGVPAEELLESSRQELLNSFLISLLITFPVAIVGYEIERRFATICSIP